MCMQFKLGTTAAIKRLTEDCRPPMMLSILKKRIGIVRRILFVRKKAIEEMQMLHFYKGSTFSKPFLKKSNFHSKNASTVLLKYIFDLCNMFLPFLMPTELLDRSAT